MLRLLSNAKVQATGAAREDTNERKKGNLSTGKTLVGFLRGMESNHDHHKMDQIFKYAVMSGYVATHK